MARNLKKGSKVFITLRFPGGRKRTKLIPGIVVRKLTVRKGSVDVDPKDKEGRILVHVRRVGEKRISFSGRPSDFKKRR